MTKAQTSILQKAFAIYALVVFVTSFLLLFPLMFLFVQFKNLRNANHSLYRIWGYIVFFFTGISRKTVWHFKPKKKQAYVYCANHTSYADIPTLYCAIKQDITFIGKSSLGRVPLFGYVYSRIHILVDRRSKDSKLETLIRSKEALDKGISLIIFPEGTIPKTGLRPHMIEFKDGAFKIAIEKQIPVVPVTIPYNYIILPDDDKMKARIHESKIIFHSPIETTGMTADDVMALKQKVFKIISAEIKAHILHHKNEALNIDQQAKY